MTTGECALCGWVVQEVITMRPQPSPPLRRVLRSIFEVNATVEQVLASYDRNSDDEDEKRGSGRWDDDGENDRPWH